MIPDVVYAPDTGLRHPWDAIRGMWRGAFCAPSRDLAWRLFVRNMRAQFRQSLLGYAWLFVPPVVNSAVFVFLNNHQIVDIPDTDTPYPVFVLLGSLLWQGLVLLIGAPMQGVQRELSSLGRLNFSREALLVASFLEGAAMAAIPLVIVPVVVLCLGVPIGWHVLMAPLGILGLFVFAFAIGVLLTPIGVLYHDVGRAIPVVTRFWMFVTPVVYALPESGRARTWLLLNPATPFIETARDWMLGRPADLVVSFGIWSALAFLALAFGVMAYRLAMPIIVERISN